MATTIQIQPDDFKLAELEALLRADDGGSGAVVTFTGVVREDRTYSHCLNEWEDVRIAKTCKSGDLPNKHPSRTTRYGQDGGQTSVMVKLYTVAGSPFPRQTY